MSDEVTIIVNEVVEEVTVTVLECTTTSEFQFLLDQKFKAGVETDVAAGNIKIEFPALKPFADSNYTAYAYGTNGILSKIETVIQTQDETGFYVYVPDSCEKLYWSAIKH